MISVSKRCEQRASSVIRCERWRAKMKLALLILLFQLFSVAHSSSPSPCAKRYFFNESPEFMVCMCNATYCDDFPPLGTLGANSAAVYVSSKSGKRFERSKISWVWTEKRIPDREDAKATKRVRIAISPKDKMQTIIGFGGAFTDSAGINIASLDDVTQEQIMQSYYGPKGIQYSLGRVPMASTDFSTREYSYDDVDGDFALRRFALAPEDYQFKIPYIKRAVKLTGGDLKLFATPWSAPGWMKDTGRMKGGGFLKGAPGGLYEQTWAQYFMRFLEEYDRSGVNFWGLTVVNQPATGFDPDMRWQAMAFTAESERDFIKNLLGPALKSSTLGRNIAIMACDDQRALVPIWANVTFSDPLANLFTPGIAVHWYLDYLAPVSVYSQTHNSWPNKFILATEACVALVPVLGNWTNGDRYANSIISNLNNWVTGWTDWNIAVDMTGGPNWVNNTADSPIVIDASKGEFYKQPMFYIMGHFSKFIRPGSVRIGLSMKDDELLEGVAFSTPNNQRVVVVRNAHTHDAYDLEIDVSDRPDQALHVTIEPESIITIVWNKLIGFGPFVI